MGVGGVALAWLLHQEGLLANPMRPELTPRRYDLTPKPTHHEPKAKAMISLFMQGGAEPCRSARSEAGDGAV